jgi:A/G-specific adenine glycosylase
MPSDADPSEYCGRRFGAMFAGAESLPLLQHEFTHFTLKIAPLVCRLDSSSQCAAEPGQVWLPLEEADKAAVPAPVRKLLVALRSA